MDTIARMLRDRMQMTAPVRTGMLRRSIYAGVSGGPGKRSLWLDVNAPYAMFLEFGTRYMTPRPFIRPAIVAIQQIFHLQAVSLSLHPPAGVSHALKAHATGFRRPGKGILTRKQEAHVRKNLGGLSRALAGAIRWRGTKFHIKHHK
jgi:hypothetical protein